VKKSKKSGTIIDAILDTVAVQPITVRDSETEIQTVTYVQVKYGFLIQQVLAAYVHGASVAELFQAGCPSCCPTDSIKAVKDYQSVNKTDISKKGTRLSQ